MVDLPVDCDGVNKLLVMALAAGMVVVVTWEPGS